ncbi:MAG: Septum formation initiator [Pedosphaera sp.]|nr:Septum formation initiator [Pedosphaera sp.]
MKVDLGIWGKLTWAVIALGLVGGLVLVVGWYLPLINQNERMRKEILKLDAQIRQEEDVTRRLKASIDAIHHDPKTVERLARESLHYAKTGETVIRFDRQPTNNAGLR